MNHTIEHIKANLVGYLLPVVAMLMWGGFTAFMDGRHALKGDVVNVEVRELKREKRKLETYLELSPKSEYTQSRKAEIRALTDEIAELEGR